MRYAAAVLCLLGCIACGEAADTVPLPVAAVGQDQASYEPDPHEPCALLEPEDVADAIGHEVAGEKEVLSKHDPEGKSMLLCLYETTPPFGSVVMYDESDVSEHEFQRRIDRDPRNTERVDVGDAAFIHAGTGMSVLVDDVAVSLSLQDFGSIDAARRALIDLAEVVVQHLR